MMPKTEQWWRLGHLGSAEECRTTASRRIVRAWLSHPARWAEEVWSVAGRRDLDAEVYAVAPRERSR